MNPRWFDPRVDLIPRSPGAKTCAIFLAFAPCVVVLLRGGSSGAPPGYTGDFGEQTCEACHGQNRSGAGTVSGGIEGAPTEYLLGRAYNLTVLAYKVNGWWFGFEISARSEATGLQAGHFVPEEGKVVTSESGIEYVTHSTPARNYQKVSWGVRWIAPDPPAGIVRFSAATVAGQDGSLYTEGYTSTAKST